MYMVIIIDSNTINILVSISYYIILYSIISYAYKYIHIYIKMRGKLFLTTTMNVNFLVKENIRNEILD